MMVFLTVKEDGVKISVSDAGKALVPEETVWGGQDCSDFIQKHGVEGLPVMCSSSMDFPDEYSDRPEVISAARVIRG